MIRFALPLALLAAVPPTPAREKVIHVPFVGCPADGQTGPVEAPKSSSTPVLRAAAAAKLAYYSNTDGLGVLVNLPIEGFRKIIGPPEEPDLLSVEVRLPSNLRHLATMILSNAAK